MEFLPENKKFPEMRKGEDQIAYINRLVVFILTNYRELIKRINWLLDRVRVTLESSEDGARYMVVEFIAPGKTRNDDGNWRFILKPDDVQLQMRRSGTWIASDIWHG